MTDSKRPLKILHIDPERFWGGGENQVIGLLSYLSSRGHLGHLVCDPGGPLLEEARARGIEVFPVRVRNELDPRPAFRLRGLLRNGAYDIVHFHTKRAHALSVWLGRSRPGLRYVVTRRMDYPPRRNWHTRYLYNRKVDAVVAISKSVAAALLEGGVSGEKIRVIPSGIDPEPFRRAWGSGMSGPPVVGTVAVLEERKGHRFLLEAAALLKRRGLKLRYRLAGEGSEEKRIQRLARELGLDGDVELLGFVSDIPGFLSTIDIFALPSLHEGLGVSALEAMAAAKPVIATRVGGLQELVEDQVSGILVPPKNAEALADSIARLVSEPELARAMGLRGLERVRQEFTLEQMARRNEELYYELLGGSAG